MADKKELRALAGEAAAYRQELERAEQKWKDINKEIKENKNLVGGAKLSLDAQKESLEKQYKSQKELRAAIKDAANEQKEYLRQLKTIEKEEAKITSQKLIDEEKIAKVQQRAADELRKRVENLKNENEEYLDLQYDITKAFGKTTNEATMFQLALAKTKGISSELASLAEGMTELTAEQKSELVGVAEEFGNINRSILQASVEHKKGIINAKQYVKTIDEAQGQWDKVEQKVQDIIDKSEDLKDITGKMTATVGETKEGAEKTTKKFTAKDVAGLTSDATNTMFGITPEVEGAVSGVSDIIAGATTAEVGGGLLAAYGAIKLAGASKEALAKLNPRPVIDVQRTYEAIEKTLENQIDQLKQYAELQAGIPGLKAGLDFRETMAKNTAAFNAASKTAFFGSALGSPKYAADQLQLVGVNAGDIVSTMSELSKTAGSGIQSLGEDVAVFSKKTGIGTGEIGNIINTIRIFDKQGGSQAFSTMESSLSQAAKDGYNLADITGQLANSAELAAEFNIGSYKALLKQITAVRQLGGDFDKIANAGKSMVLNYKDSIKAEMTLGAILGENVDLSQVRALFAAGRPEEAFALLKSSGLAAKAQAAGLFAVEALKQATGGLDITQMRAAEYQKGPGIGIQSNAAFLEAFKEAQRVLTIDNAYISAGYALLTTQQVGMAQISAEFYSEIAEGINGLIAKQAQQKFIGQAKSELAKNKAALGFGPEGQIGNFNYKQYGIDARKDIFTYPRTQQTGYFSPSGFMPATNTSTTNTKAIERLVNIANAFVKMSGSDFEKYQSQYSVSDYETEQAKQLLNKKTTYGGGAGGSYSYDTYTLDENKVAALKAKGLTGTGGAVITTTIAPNDKSLQVTGQTLKVNQDSLKRLETIDTATNATTALLKNIEILQGMMVNLTNKEFNLILDGKDITSAVTQRVVNSTGVTKDPTLRVRGFQ